MSAWLWLAGLFVLLTAAFVAALRAPLELRLSARFPGAPILRADIHGLWGLLDVRVRKGRQPEPAPSPEPDRQVASDADDASTRAEPETDEPDRVEKVLDSTVGYLETRRDLERKIQAGLALLRTDGFPLEVVRLLRELVRVTDVDRIGLSAGFGLGTPAQTGRVYGQLSAAFAWTHATDRVQVDLDPDFQAEGLEGEADVQLSARTWYLLRPLIVFLLAQPTREAISNARGELDR